MRVLIAAAFMLCRCVAAQDNWPVVLLDEKDAQGHRVQFRSDTNTLLAQPIWTPGGEGPPMTLEGATKIVMRTALRQSGKARGVSFDSIRLLKNELDYPHGHLVSWFWVFCVSPVIDENPDQPVMPIIEPVRDIIVLLDGKVIEATPVK